MDSSQESGAQIKFKKVTASSSGANEIVAAVTGRKIRVLGGNLSAITAVNAKWQSASTDLTGLAYLPATTTTPIPACPWGNFETVAAEALNLNLSGAVAVGGWIQYQEV